MDPGNKERGDRAARATGRMARGAAVAVILPFYLAWDLGRGLIKGLCHALAIGWGLMVSGLTQVPPRLAVAVEPLAVAIDDVVGIMVRGVGKVVIALGRTVDAILAPIRWTIGAVGAGIRRVARIVLSAISWALATIGRAVRAVLKPLGHAFGAAAASLRAGARRLIEVTERGFAWAGRVLEPLAVAILSASSAVACGLRDVLQWGWSATRTVARGIIRASRRAGSVLAAMFRGIGAVVGRVVGIIGPPISRASRFMAAMVASGVSVTARGIARFWRLTGHVAGWVADHGVMPIVAGAARLVRSVRMAIERVVGPPFSGSMAGSAPLAGWLGIASSPRSRVNSKASRWAYAPRCEPWLACGTKRSRSSVHDSGLPPSGDRGRV